MSILQSQFRISRRGSGQGDFVLDRIPYDRTWELLINTIWQYQWTNKETKLTEELSNILYEESQGITDIVKKLYAMAQIKAITSGKEVITCGLIKQVATENLKLVQPMLQALKTGDIKKIAKYDDICLINIDFNGCSSKMKQSMEMDIRAKAIKRQKSQKEKTSLIDKKTKAVLKLIDLGINAKKAQKAVDNVDNGEDCVDENVIVIKAISLLSDTTKQKSKTKKESFIPDDIRFVVQEGKKTGVSAYDALKTKGYIVKFEDDIFNMR